MATLTRTLKKLATSGLYRLLYGNPSPERGSGDIPLASLGKILVVRDDHIGDMICSLPVFEAIKKACPQAHVTLLASSYNAQIAEGNPFIDDILYYPRHKLSLNQTRLRSAWQQYRFLKSLRPMGFDLAIGLRSHFSRRQAQIVFASGAPYRLGHFPQRERYRHFSFVYNIPAINPRAYKHELERSLDVIRAIGIDLENPSPVVTIDPAGRTFADAFWSDRNITGSPVIGYHISNRDDVNRWPLDQFATLIQLFKQRFPRSEHIVTFAPGEDHHAENLATMSGDRCHAIATRRIKDLGAVQQRCHLFVTVDGAPNHLAAALGTPTLTLFGGSDPVVWGPWGPQHQSIKISDDIKAILPEQVFVIAIEMLGRSVANTAAVSAVRSSRLGTRTPNRSSNHLASEPALDP